MDRDKYVVVQVGQVVKEATGNCLKIFEEYRPALLELENYSHIHVYWWANLFDNVSQRGILVTDIPYAKNIKAGVFACRSPERPNLVMDSVCKIRGVDKRNGVVYIEDIDANAGSPIIDIKPYIPCVDRVKEARVPKWFPSEWGEWLPKKGIK
jgi:tRNA-Thr(GGU) m(6)t(6)A37 methyltransferase TsaA